MASDLIPFGGGGVPSTNVRIVISLDGASVNRAFRQMDTMSNRLRRSIQNMGVDFRRLDRIWSLLAITGGAALIRTFFNFAVELQKTQLQIGAFTRDVSEIEPTMNKVIALTDRVPFTLNTMTQAFVKLKAAGLDPIVDDQGNGPLKALADGVAAFGGGEEIFKRATIAIQQMAGKGVISMEELRQQLGEAIPTAMRVMAEQMGYSVSKFIVEVSRGNIEAQAGFDALFKGLEEKFGGAGELLKATFSGQQQQFVLEMQKLSKALLLDTGGLDVIAAGLKIINEEIKKFVEFLKTTEGAAAIDKFNKQLIDAAEWAYKAAQSLGPLISILGSFGQAVAGIISALPVDAQAGGVIGWMLFGGVKGAAFGALVGSFSEIFGGLQNFVGQVARVIKDLLGSLSMTEKEVIGGGIIGFILFGPKGALIGALAGLFSGVIKAWEAFAFQLTRLTEALSGGLKEALFSIFSDESFGDAFARGWFDAAKEYEAKFRQEMGAGADAIINHYKQVNSVLSTTSSTAATARVSVGETGTAVQGFFDRLRQSAADTQEARKAIIEGFAAIYDVGGMSPTQLSQFEDLAIAYERLRVQVDGAGSAFNRQRAVLKAIDQDWQALEESLVASLNALADNDSRRSGIEAEIALIQSMRKSYAEMGDELLDKMAGGSMDQLTRQAQRLEAQFKQFLVPGTDAVTVAIAEGAAQFAGYISQIETLRQKIMLKTDADHGQIEALQIIDGLLAGQTEAWANYEQRIIRNIELQKELTAIQEAYDMRAQERDYASFLANMNFDDVKAATLQAQGQIDGMLTDIREKIIRIQQKASDGLITQEAADETIARLNQISAGIEANSQTFVERAAFNASEWGKMMNSIADSMEDAFAGALTSIVQGTKSMKDVLLDFYNAITAAVIRYLAHQAMVGLFGQQGGFGQALGSIFTPFGGGGLLGFAEGGSFKVGGIGGIDKNLLSINGQPVAKVGMGETVSIDKYGGGGQPIYNINISAIDGASVRKVFLQEGPALLESLNHQMRLNRA